MREIKFRGKRIENGEWAFGMPAFNRDCSGVDKIEVPALSGGICTLVDPETVGEYAGQKDINGKEIYEGDIVNRRDEGFPLTKNWNGVVKMITGSYLVENLEGTDGEYLFDELAEVEVIGNIYDNPELLIKG